jgi:hypothetical protein
MAFPPAWVETFFQAVERMIRSMNDSSVSTPRYETSPAIPRGT